MTPAHDEPLEEQAARAPTQAMRETAHSFRKSTEQRRLRSSQKIHTSMVFFGARELQALERDLARLERICRTAETGVTIKYGMLGLIPCKRRCRVIGPCAMDTHDGEVESEGYERPAQLERHPDIRAWYFIPQATTN